MRVNAAFLGGVVAPAVVALAALLLVPQFVSVLAQFGDLPWVSRTVLATYQWWLLVPVTIAVLSAVTGLHRTHAERVSRAGVVVAGGLAVMAVVGLYAPIFSLAQG